MVQRRDHKRGAVGNAAEALRVSTSARASVQPCRACGTTMQKHSRVVDRLAMQHP